jgi:hypothetical protein
MYTLKKRKIKRENIPSYTELKLKVRIYLTDRGDTIMYSDRDNIDFRIDEWHSETNGK